MKVTTTNKIIVGVVVLIIGYWAYNRYRSKKAIEQVKDDELSNTVTTPEIPKMYIRAGVNVPAGAMSFVDDKK